MRIAVGLLALVLLVTTTACGRVAPPGDAAGQPGEPAWVEPTCPKVDASRSGPVLPPGMSTPRSTVPDGFVTAWVLRCRSEIRDLPGKGKWNVDITERADTDAAELVEQLRRPSDPRSDGPCTAEAVIPPYFALVDATGRAFVPAVPTDGCGKPRAEAMKLLDTLPFRALSEVPRNQVQSPRSIDTGCSDSWKDLFRIAPVPDRPGPAKPVWPTEVSTVQVCVYDRISGTELPVGQLSAARTVSGAEATAIVAALDGAPAAAPCTATHTRFAVVRAESVADRAMVELDGCHRLLRPDNTLGQLDAPTVASLFG